MRFCTSILAGLVVSALTVSVGRASLVINLRFANGSTTHTLTPADVGTDIEIDVWATITGNNPVSGTNFDGLTYVYYSAASSLPGGPGTAVNGGIDAGANALVSPFGADGSQLGATQDINGDGVADVGSTTDMLAMNKPRGALPPPSTVVGIFDDNPAAVGNAVPDGYEFEVEKLYFHVNGLAVGETEFTPEVPSLSSFAPYVPANWFQDSSTDTESPPNPGFMNGAYSGGTSVTFVAVPEPSSVAILLGVWGLAMGRRRGSLRD